MRPNGWKKGFLARGVCKEGAPLLVDNSNWNWGGQNPLFGAWGEQWMMDMANLYSSQDYL